MSHDLADPNSRMTYDRFLEFERLSRGYHTTGGRLYNATPIGFCAFSLTLFVYSMYMAGATVPVTTSAAMAMGLGLFYGGLIELLAGLYELRQGNNFYALTFCSYAGFWFGLAALYVTGSWNFSGAVTDATAQSNAFGVFFLAWTIFTLFMLIASIRSNAVSVIFFFFLLITYVLLTASYFLNGHTDLRRAAGAIGIFTAVIGWYKGFANLLKRGDNAYFNLPLFDISRRPPVALVAGKPVDVRGQV
jgi:uncharacterized protein